MMGWVRSAVPSGEEGRAGRGAPVLLSLPQPPQAPAQVLFLSNFPHTESGFFITQFWSVIKH